MSDAQDAEQAKLAALHKRIAFIEAHLGITAPAPIKKEVPPLLVVKAPPAKNVESAPPITPSPPTVVSKQDVLRHLTENRRAQDEFDVEDRPARTPTFSTPSSPKPREPVDLEQLIGGKWFAAIGALVVMAGVSFGVKFAWDQGWIGLIPDLVKVLAGFGFGLALLTCGEIALRKINAAASAGLSAAGIGAVYASGYAAYSVYHLVNLPGSFLILFLTAIAGVAIAVRAQLASVAVLSLIGGYFAPVLLSTDKPHPYFFTTYLSVLLISALTLSAWQGRSKPTFHALRTVGWWGTIMLGLAWALREGADYPEAALPFFMLVWAAVHGERFAASQGLFTTEAQAERDSESDRVIKRDLAAPPLLASDFELDWRAVAASLSTTVWAVMLGIMVLEDGTILPTWLAPGVLTAVCVVVSMIFAGHLRVLQDVPRTDAERIGAGLLFQSGALLIVTFALAFGGWALVLAWLALGLAAIGAGRWIGARGLDYYGLVVLALATMRLMALGAMFTPWGAGQDILGMHITDWGLRFALTGGVWIVASVLMLVRNPSRMPLRSIAALHVGVAMVLTMLGHPDSQSVSVIFAWLGVAGALVGLDYIAPRIWARAVAMLVCVATLAYWSLQNPFVAWAEHPSTIGLHPDLWLSVAIAGAVLFVSRLGRWDLMDTASRATLRVSAICLTMALLFSTTSLEVARGAEQFAHDDAARGAALSIYWGLFGAGLLIVGFAKKLPPARQAGLGLIGIATAKTVIFDLASVTPGWRIISFLALGVLMLAVAVVYAKVTAALTPSKPSAIDDPPTL